jgi:hypothetical protein
VPSGSQTAAVTQPGIGLAISAFTGTHIYHPESNCVVADPNRGNAHMWSCARATGLKSTSFLNNLRGPPLAFALPIRISREAPRAQLLNVLAPGGVMATILIFARMWRAWYRVLRYGTGLSWVDFVRFDLWLARG